MTIVRVVVKPSTLVLSKSDFATGDVAVVLGLVVFPSPDWNDFVVVILEAWLSALVRLARNASAMERVHFMEGPYAIDLTRLDGGAVRLCAIERPARQRAVVEVPLLALLDDAGAAADAILQVCRGARASKDVDRLKEALVKLGQVRDMLLKGEF